MKRERTDTILAEDVTHKNAYAHIADKYRWCKKKAYAERYSALYLVKNGLIRLSVIAANSVTVTNIVLIFFIVSL